MVRKPDSVYLYGRKKFWVGILLGCGLFGLTWLLFHYVSLRVVSQIGVAPSPVFSSGSGTPPALLAEAGVMLTSPTQAAVLSQAQALQIADQIEPDAATGAQTINAGYVLLTYAGAKNGLDLQNVPVWMVWFQKVPQLQTNVALDVGSSHDLYVFLNATTGQMELTIWV